MPPKVPIIFNRPHLFHTLKDLFAYARSEGFTNGDLQNVRKHLKEQRAKPFRKIHDWRVVTIHFSRKDWDKKSDDPKWYSTRSLQTKRWKGEWLARIIDSEGNGWMWLDRDFTDGSWKDPIIHPDSRKLKIRMKREKSLEENPECLEIS